MFHREQHRPKKLCHTATVRSLSISPKLALAFITALPLCTACTIVFSSIQVGPNFRVRVENQGHTAQGLRLEMGGARGSRIVRHTNKDGFAYFRAVPPGSYHLRADGIQDGVYLEVGPNGPDVTVPLKRPSLNPVSVRALKGTIRGPDFVPGQPQPRLSLDLLDGISGQTLKSFETDDKGEFDAHADKPGMYFLKLKPSGLKDSSRDQIGGLIVVALDGNAPADHLDLDLGWTSCGMFYSDTSKCPQTELQIEQLSGQISDPSRGRISRANITLLDTSGKIIEQLQSDASGEFSSPRALSGTYQLIVTSPGFTPYRHTIRAQPATDSTHRSLLTVQLGVFGACSTAGIQ